VPNETEPIQGEHTISVLVRNRPRVLARVAGLFARRGFNIDSLAVSTTEDETTSRMTIATTADRATLAPICKQVGKLHDVVRVMDHTHDAVVERELCLCKVGTDRAERSEIVQVCDIFRGDVVDIGNGALMIQVIGDKEKIDAFVRVMREYHIQEMVRTGKIVLSRGVQPT
jgi:acetolactate synthase-1/3 small subunit